MELGTDRYIEPTEPVGPILADEDPEDFAAGVVLSGIFAGLACGCLPGVIAGGAAYATLVGVKWTGKRLWRLVRS